MSETVVVQELEALLAASSASEAFKDAVRALAAGKAQDRITANAGAPPVKVLRVTMKLLEVLPDRPLETLAIDAASGCSNFTGKAVAEPGKIMIDFHWDCAWRAREQDWKDAFGDPDQIRAARTYGYQCFEKFTVQ